MNESAIGLALQAALRSMSEVLLFEATNPWELDEAMTEFGFSSGACEAQDIEGLDVALAHNSQSGCHQITPILPRMVAEGRLGRKVSVGWYRYPGGGGLVIDPLVEDLLREEARFEGITRRDISNNEIVAHLTLALVNASADIMANTSLSNIGQVNDASIKYLGFPAATGGVLSYAAGAGIDAILARLTGLRYGPSKAMKISNHLELLRGQL
ncbi:3-hydroxyacyl-CoA dehydrogenase family protein [Roseobacter sp. EG26]|uniref:3-hydroxyacyl-CoA dehydrogenase family protein n=1 Tax=Roseobacter sp. EG26 TaxID=3412477 RepID=UPI003CE46C8A